MTRHIRPHKGGRTVTAPSARMTPQERERLDMVLAERNVKHTDWYIGHVEQDYAEITGDDTMYMIDYKVGLSDAPNGGWVPAARDFGSIRKCYKYESEAQKDADDLAKKMNVKTRVRKGK